MRVRSLLVVTAFVVALGAGAAFALWLQLTIAVTAAAVVLFTVTRCPHRHATLLPPVRDAGPERDHARWYCDQCGAEWAASFSASTRPRLVYDARER